MASKHESSLRTPITTFSKNLQPVSLRQQKNNHNCKKLFSRKPLNNSLNCSRILSSRLKTQQDDSNYPENPNSANNSLGNLLNQSKSVKFVSTRSSTSLEKLFLSTSAEQLPTLSQLPSKKYISEQGNVYNFNSKHNKLIQSPKFTELFKQQSSQLEIIYDLEKDDHHSKDNLGSTELSSNENICNQDSNEDDFKNHLLPRSKRNQTFSFYHPKDNKNLHKECPSCLINSQKIQELQHINKKLEETLSAKQLYIKKLNHQIQRFSKSLKDNQTLKTSLEYEIKTLKEREHFISSQKDEVDITLKKLQTSYAKLNQQIKYKDLELNIHKIYKTKSLELEMKVETLKKQLNRAKNTTSKLLNSKSSESLRGKEFKLDLAKIGNFKRHDSQKRLKQPKIARVYSEDSIFSLSSEECD